ncbi:antirepressor [Ligilactobacillus salivarius]|uniref:antirepressor n=1 Tax=Ligilactobacillus salivarius TaxID=1624 RepID=UPI0002F3D68F|nr:antirepressor [Ligilactobacillus salivarius]MYV19908.1 XRE family transcriptional regulator [Ligilactobacillus salivarius]UIP52214.1 XRE family transcriptional regulator [Ligilactobacillus salivarius]
MPETKAGRDKIVEYLEENDISVTSLAVAYGIKKQDMSDFLTGRKITPRGNRVILKIISDLRIK